MLAKRVAASAVKATHLTVVVAAKVVLVTMDVDAGKDIKGVMGEANEIVAGVIKIAEECPTLTTFISPTPFAHLPTKNGPRSVQAVGDPISLSNA